MNLSLRQSEKLNAITTDDLEELTIKLADRGLSTSTRNQIILICSTALKWACKKKIISANPAVGLTRFSVTHKKRDVLTKRKRRRYSLDPFIFYSMRPEKPIDPLIFREGFFKALDKVNENYREAAEKAKLEEPEIFIDYKARNIVFHSWRHWFCSKLTEIIEGEKVAKVSGHLSEAVFKKYADHIRIGHAGDALQVIDRIAN